MSSDKTKLAVNVTADPGYETVCNLLNEIRELRSIIRFALDKCACLDRAVCIVGNKSIPLVFFQKKDWDEFKKRAIEALEEVEDTVISKNKVEQNNE